MSDTQGGDSWSTPGWMFQWLHDQFDFNLDAAASPENAKCPSFYSEPDDALLKAWGGIYASTVWCNPPYSNPAPWIEKALSEVAKGNAQTVVMLLPSDTSTRWFLRGAESATSLLFLVPRIKFGGVSSSPRFGSALFVFGKSKFPAGITFMDLTLIKKSYESNLFPPALDCA